MCNLQYSINLLFYICHGKVKVLKKIVINLGEQPEYILKYNTKEWKFLKLYLKVKCIEFWSSLKRTAQYLFHKTIKIQNCCFHLGWIAVYIEKGLSMLRLLTLCIQKIKETSVRNVVQIV